jgi:general secretion pathway protein M
VGWMSSPVAPCLPSAIAGNGCRLLFTVSHQAVCSTFKALSGDRAIDAMANLPTGRTGRLLAVGILVIAVVAGCLFVVAPLLDFYNQREAAIADHRMLLPRLRTAAQQLPELRANLAELQKVASTRKITLEGNSDAIASANLQSRIEELAASAGVTIGRSEAVSAETRSPYRRIGLRVAVSGEYDGILKLVGAIETAAPPLVVANLQIHGTLRPVNPIAAPQIPTRLDAVFEVYGFRSPEASVAGQK